MILTEQLRHQPLEILPGRNGQAKVGQVTENNVYRSEHKHQCFLRGHFAGSGERAIQRGRGGEPQTLYAAAMSNTSQGSEIW